VLSAVNWHTVSKDKPEAWLYFYEEFPEVYDNTRRTQTGFYYTPPNPPNGSRGEGAHIVRRACCPTS
jgi:hypothetical protein